MKNIGKSILEMGFTGRIGGVVFYCHRNQLCARSLPAEVKAPSAPGQLAQQERMTSIAIFYHALKSAGLYACWQKAADGLPQNGYNLLVQTSLPAFDEEGKICDFSKLQITRGTLDLPCGLTLERNVPGEWVLEWEDVRRRNSTRGDDAVRLYVMKDEETFDVEPLETGGCRRGDGRCVFRIPEKYEEFPHLYVFFCSCTGEECSNSRYFLLTHKS